MLQLYYSIENIESFALNLDAYSDDHKSLESPNVNITTFLAITLVLKVGCKERNFHSHFIFSLRELKKYRFLAC